VSRATCHLLGVLAGAMGVRFEPFASHFLPQMFKVTVITVQVCSRLRSLGVLRRESVK
jgi:hypothetical protein